MKDPHTDGSPLDQRLTTYTVLPAVKLSASKEKAEHLLDALESWTITDNESAATAGSLLRQAHDEAKKLDKLRLEAGKPAREAQKDINNFFKPTIEAWTKAKTKVKGLLDDHRRAVDEANRQAMAELQPQAMVPAPQVEGVTYRNEVKIEIVDFDKIPREWLTVDWSKLKIHARQGGEAPEGVKFVQEQKAQVKVR